MHVERDTGLVLEGDGTRDVFISGVLGAFVKHSVYFRYIVTVSAGACNDMSCISRQPRRTRLSNVDSLTQYGYIGWRHLLRQGCIFDQELLYNKFLNEYLPLDFDTFFQWSATFGMVATSCLTGQAEYLMESKGRQRSLGVVHASSSLPYASKTVMVDGTPMLGGGIVDSIPMMRAIEAGHPQNVVILTRNKDYRSKGRDHKIPPFAYKKYPRLRVALSHRVTAYNEQPELVERPEELGKVVCIRPQRSMEVGRMERGIGRLERLYQKGFMLGNAFCGTLL